MPGQLKTSVQRGYRTMAKAGIYNLCIQKGSTFGPITIQLNYSVVLTEDAPVGATSLRVSPLNSEYLASQVLTFGGVQVTLTTTVPVGGTTLPINALTAALSRGDQATGNPVNLTGIGARGKIKKAYTDPTGLADLTCTIGTPPTQGLISISLSSDTAVADNISPLNFSQIQDWATKSQLTREDRRLFNTGVEPYVWDLETFDTANPPNVKRRMNGMVAVTSEVTT